MRKSIAWELRNDGEYFEINTHLYCMKDEDLFSEASCASFLINTGSGDINLAKEVINSWMALKIQDEVTNSMDIYDIRDMISECIVEDLQEMEYPLSIEECLGILAEFKSYSDIDEYYEFIDSINVSKLSQDLSRCMNQIFCRVRYGGQYDTYADNSEIWFRISSVGFNWVNIIYSFVDIMKNKYKIKYVSICRDAESDGETSSKFYKAKDGTYYKHLPISEYQSEEHESNPRFESVCSGILNSMRLLLSEGKTFKESVNIILNEGAICRSEEYYYTKFLKDEYKNYF